MPGCLWKWFYLGGCTHKMVTGYANLLLRHLCLNCMKFILTILILVLSPLIMSAQDSVQVIINNKKAAEAVVTSDHAKPELQIKRPRSKKAKTFIIKISGKLIGQGNYMRSLEISGDSSLMIEEIKNKPGWFNLSKTNTEDLLRKGKPLSLYLLLDPANPLMAFPSKRIFLGNLIMK